MSAHDETHECPICMDVLSGTKNIVTTECGHCFHTNCLMTSVAHNGFGCPYCRTEMAAAPEESDDDDSEWGSYDEDDDELYGDHSLRGARWLFQRANGEEVDDEEDSTQMFAQARQYVQNDDHERAIYTLQEIVSRFPQTQTADKARRSLRKSGITT